MFFNLAWRNSKRNRSENLIYFLTMVTAVATFYIVLSLGSQDVMRFLEEIESDAVNRLLTMLMPTVYLFSLLFVFFLVIFANKYQLECRSRELGLYLMFGMTKRHLFIQIMAEGLITSLLALLGGLICGGFCETQHNTRSIYFHSAAVTRKYSPQVYFNRRCVYFDYAYYHAHCRRINPHYVVWEPNDAGIFCLRFYRHGQ